MYVVVISGIADFWDEGGGLLHIGYMYLCMELTCPNKECSHSWNYKGKKSYPSWVCCPDCLRRVKLPKVIDDFVMTNAELGDHLRARLHDGWMLITGDRDAVSKVVEHAYPNERVDPQTYEIVGFPMCLSIGKKTDRMKGLLGNPAHFDDLLGIEVHGYDDGKRANVSYFVPLPDGVESCIDDMVEQALAFLDDDRKV